MGPAKNKMVGKGRKRNGIKRFKGKVKRGGRGRKKNTVDATKMSKKKTNQK